MFKNKFLLTILLLFIIFSFKYVYASMGFQIVSPVTNPDTSLKLQWNINPSAVYYKVYNEDTSSSNTLTLLKTLDILTDLNYNSYIATDLIPNTEYKFKIYSLNSNNEILENELRASSTQQMIRPVMTNYNYDINSKTVTLTWDNVSSAATRTYVMKDTNTSVANVAANVKTVTFVDPAISTNNSVYYYLKTIDNNSNEALGDSGIYINPIKAPNLYVSRTDNKVKITFSDNQNIHMYQLERSKYGTDTWGEWSIINSTIENYASEIIDTLDDFGAYRYRLKINTGVFGGNSNLSEPVIYSLSPENLECSLIHNMSIKLTWDELENNVEDIKIERKDGNNSYRILNLVEPNITEYIDTSGIQPNTIYKYRISIYESATGNWVGTESEISTGRPTPVDEIYIETLNDESLILNWVDTSNNEYEFVIKRKINVDEYVELSRVSQNVTSYTDNDLVKDSRYSYVVIPSNIYGFANSYSKEVSIIVGDMAITPTSLTLEPQSSTEILLKWTENSSTNSYGDIMIERKNGDNESWEFVARVAPNKLEYLDNNLLQSTEYSYRLKGIISESVFSKAYPIDSLISTYTKLKSPKNIKASRVALGHIKLSWDDISNETTFSIEKKLNDSDFRIVSFVNENYTSWIDKDTTLENTYTYRITSRNATNISDVSEEVFVPKAIQNLNLDIKYSVYASDNILFEWDNTIDREETLIFERRKNIDTSDFIKIGEANFSDGMFKSENISANTEYIYRIGASNNLFKTLVYDDEFKIKTDIPEIITSLSGYELTPFSIQLQWEKPNNDIDGYIISKKIRNKFKDIFDCNKKQLSFVDKTVINNSKNIYKIKAYKKTSSGILFGEISNEIIIRTSDVIEFEDSKHVPWAKEQTKYLKGLGILDKIKTNSNTLGVNEEITRGEFVQLIINSLDISKPVYGSFKDVLPSHKFYSEIMTAKYSGIVSGVGDNYFKPDNKITREDITVILLKALRAKGHILKNYDKDKITTFTDNELVSDYAYQSMTALINEGIINGTIDSKLLPKNNTTKAQTSVIIYNILKMLENKKS